LVLIMLLSVRSNHLLRNSYGKDWQNWLFS